MRHIDSAELELSVNPLIRWRPGPSGMAVRKIASRKSPVLDLTEAMQIQV